MRRILSTCVIGLTLAAGWALFWNRSPRTRSPLPQEAYLWQRAWTPAVEKSVADHSSQFSRIVVLAGEISWKNGQPTVQRVAVHYDALRNAGLSVGMALRIGSYGGAFNPSGEPLATIHGVIASILAEARAANVPVAEMQIDFDCAESKLAGYQIWIESLRSGVAPVPITITALPSWLNRGEFKPLAKAAGGFVLQVHSFERPVSVDAPFMLCDPEIALKSVEKAGQVGVPFRVALPTYGYLIAFDRTGKFIGLSAEGRAPAWPADVNLRDIRADPVAMASLIQHWSNDRPASMQGVIWYRLPNKDDRLNWRWSTLAAVIAGRAPMADVRVEVRQAEPDLFEIELVNHGDADGAVRWQVDIDVASRQVEASDALGGFEKIDAPEHAVRLRATSPLSLQRLGPDQHKAIGWLRLSGASKNSSADKEVQTHVEPISP